MGRELRRVPPDWEHPRDEQGRYIPLFDQAYKEALADWHYGDRLWQEGRHPDQGEYPRANECATYEEWHGPPPVPDQYRREKWGEDDTVCWQVYENVTEGTPLSPVLATLDDVRAWLLDNGYDPAGVETLISTGYLPTFSAHGDASTLRRILGAE